MIYQVRSYPRSQMKPVWYRSLNPLRHRTVAGIGQGEVHLDDDCLTAEERARLRQLCILAVINQIWETDRVTESSSAGSQL